MIELPFLASKPFSRVLDYSQKNHCNDNCNDFSDYNDIIAPLDGQADNEFYSLV